MEEMGLAKGMAQPQIPKGENMLKEIAAMLMQGMSPEELVAQGVPQELVQAAMQMVMKEQITQPQEEAGLAANQVKASSM